MLLRPAAAPLLLLLLLLPAPLPPPPLTSVVTLPSKVVSKVLSRRRRREKKGEIYSPFKLRNNRFHTTTRSIASRLTADLSTKYQGILVQDV